MESQCYQDKLSQYKIGGPTKPFIDQNLQIHLPDWDFQPNHTHSSHSPIYSHYVGSSPSSYLSSQFNETELHHAITEAEHAYKGWKKMQQKLREAAQAYQEMSV